MLLFCNGMQILLNMKESLISFKTAKLAKEKSLSIGSPICYVEYHSDYVYDEDPTHQESHKSGEISLWYSYYENNNEETIDIDEYFSKYEAPTQSLLQKYLREKHKIYIEVRHSHKDLSHYCYYVYSTWDEYCTQIKDLIIGEVIYYSTYEEALESGLQEALILLSNNERF